MNVPCRPECSLRQLPERLQASAVEVVSEEGRMLRQLVDSGHPASAVAQVESGRLLTASEAERFVLNCVATCPQFHSYPPCNT